jgi:aminoglycoside phosphotransferase (APT) family kinase protein
VAADSYLCKRGGMPFADLTTAVAREALASLGLHVTEGELSIEARGERWLVRVPERRIAWFAASEFGLQTMATERRVLQLLAERCSFDAPRVLHVSTSGELQVRSMVPGDADPWRTFAEVCTSGEIGSTIGSAVGAMLAEQHTRILAADVAGWLPHRPSWPESSVWIHDRLPRVVDDAAQIDRAARIMDAYERVTVSDADRVLVHNDLGLHNLGIDAATHRVHGIFDYEEAAWADRHHDFRYLVFDRDRYALFDAAVAAYEPLTGLEIERDRVLLYNAACALTFLALRDGTKPEDRSCGRTLAEDLRWSTFAMAQVLRDA